MSNLDWSDELFEEIEKGNYVLVVPSEPGKQPIVVTIGRGTLATMAFSQQGVHMVDHSGEEPTIRHHGQPDPEPADEPF